MNRFSVIKVCYGSKTVVIQPQNKDLNNFFEEVRIRMPHLRTKKFEIMYKDRDGDKITICNSVDFAMFLALNINKVLVACKRGPRSKQMCEHTNRDEPTNQNGPSSQANRESLGEMAGTSTQRCNLDNNATPNKKMFANISTNEDIKLKPSKMIIYGSDDDSDDEGGAVNTIPTDPNTCVTESVAIMMDMGYENDDNWLDDVLQFTQGDISQVIDFLSPNTETEE